MFFTLVAVLVKYLDCISFFKLVLCDLLSSGPIPASQHVVTFATVFQDVFTGYLSENTFWVF